MTAINFSIADEIFARFPEFIRGVIVAREVKNCPSPPDLVALLRTEEQALRNRLTTDTLLTEPRIITWREAFRSLGIKPSEFRPSTEAMARRIINGNELPSINALVDIGNIISLRYLMPAGGHALDAVSQPIALRAALGTEEFIPFGSGPMEHPEKGEFIFVEGNDVLTRRWVWRQSNHTLTELSTTFIEYNLDGLPPVTLDEIRVIGEDLANMVVRFCGGTAELEILSPNNRKILISG